MKKTITHDELRGRSKNSHCLSLVIVACAFAMLATVAARAEEDHLTGYKISDLNQVPPPANPYTITNEFGSETCDLKKPQFFFEQSEKNGGDDSRGGAAGRFICYKAKCSGPLPPITDLDSQFGLHSIETKKAKLVCLPVVPPCSGVIVGGSCWYLGAPTESCDAACAAVGKTCDPATTTFAGSGGTNANCDSVLNALGAGIGVLDIPCGSNNAGCYVSFGNAHCTAPTTTCGATVSPGRRACACQ